MAFSSTRRIHKAHLAYGDGTLLADIPPIPVSGFDLGEQITLFPHEAELSRAPYDAATERCFGSYQVLARIVRGELQSITDGLEELADFVLRVDLSSIPKPVTHYLLARLPKRLDFTFSRN